MVGTKGIHPFKKRHNNSYPVLGEGAQKVSDLRLSHYVPLLSVTNDMSLIVNLLEPTSPPGPGQCAGTFLSYNESIIRYAS